MFAPMGFTGPIAEFLVEARLGGADFTETLTLGHQSLFVSPRRLGRLLARNALWPPGLTLREFYAGFTESPGYVDSFLRGLGAQRVDSMDASPYERAGIIHDLNTPVPDELKESYTVILPGGTLEHVFNFPIALKSCMEMLRPGGRLFIYAVGNQQFGHGFYSLPVQPRSLLFAPSPKRTASRWSGWMRSSASSTCPRLRECRTWRKGCGHVTALAIPHAREAVTASTTAGSSI